MEYTTGYTYDQYGNMLSKTDPEGNSKLYTYSGTYHHAYLTAMTNALGDSFSLSYDFNTGLITSITTPNGNTSFYEYDLIKRVTKKINPDLTEKEITYDDGLNYVTIYDELDHITRVYYDGLDRKEKIEWYSNGGIYASETYSYDYQNNLLSKTDAGGSVYSYEYDAQGRTVKMINPDGTFSTIEYDDENNIITYTDENGHRKEALYDWEKRLHTVREYIDSTTFYSTQYEYDQMNNLIHMTNANGEETELFYDSLFGPTQILYPDGTSKSYTYDNIGNILSEIDEGRVTTYTYDTIYQRTHIQYDDGSEVHFTYDAEGNKLSVFTDSSQIYHSYDTRSRLIEKTHLIDGSEYSFTFNYDDSGHLISIEYPDNTVIDQTFDDLGRLTDIGTYAHYDFTLDSLIETQSYGNGVITSYTYDTCHRPLSITAHKNQNLLSLEYTYDFVGNITQLEKEWIDPALQTQKMTAHLFSYDALDRLIQATGGGDSLSFSYDPVGNRVQHTYNGSATAYSYLPYDQLESTGEWNFTYDAYGNQIAKTSLSEEWTYDFDAHDRLTAVLRDDQTIGTYSYNGADQRIKKTEWNEQSQQFETVIYAHAFGRVYYEKNITSNTETLYIYGATGRIAKKCGEEIMYYHTDHLGTTHLLTDSSGTPITAVEYEPFGDANLSGENERYLYTGQEIDTSGLYYYRARYYDVETGRFLSRDRWIGDYRRPQTLNNYVYCVNNPLKYSDPTGNSFSVPMI